MRPGGQEVKTRVWDKEEGFVETFAGFGIAAVVGAEAIGQFVNWLSSAGLGKFLFEEDH